MDLQLLFLICMAQYVFSMNVCSQPGVLSVFDNTENRSEDNCDQSTLTCNSLQSAIDFIIYNSANENFTICLHGSRTHFIKSKTFFGNISLQLVAVSSAVIECDYPANLEIDVTNKTDYTWYFDQSHTVLFKNISFNNCPYPIRTVAVKYLTIVESTFSIFSEAVLDIFNCQFVLLDHLLFEGNIGTGTFFQSYRGNTGAVALGYQQYPDSFESPVASFHSCHFINNTALAFSTFLTSEQVLSRRVFTGRGGALGIFINEHVHSVSIDIQDCDIIGNYARSLGGGVFIIINGDLPTQHVLTFSKTKISSNTGKVAGSGVFLGFLSSTDTLTQPHTVVFRDCNFEENIGLSGGGIYIITSFTGIRGNYFKFERCNFTGNRGVGLRNEFGAAIGVALFTIFEQRVTAVRHDIIDCTFSLNSGGNGIVNIGYAPVRFSGRNVFVGNTGAALRIIGSLVDFDGEVTFLNNTVSDEGALSLLSFGQMRFHRGLTLNFERNSGRLGSSVVVSTPDTLTAFTRLLYNPQCFVLNEDMRASPTEWEEITVNLEHNTATLSSALYLSQLDQCSWFSLQPPYFDDRFIRRWPVWKFRSNTNTGYRDSNNSDYYIGTRAREISIRKPSVTAWPGMFFNMSLVGIDHFGHYTSTNARFFQSVTGNNNEEVRSPIGTLRFIPEIAVVAGSFGNGLLTDEFPMQYSVRKTENFTNGSQSIVGIEEPFKTLPISAGEFSLISESCPGGYRFTQRTRSQIEIGETDVVCACVDAVEIIACEDDQDGVIIKDGFWAGYAPMQASNLFLYPCPPGYCQCTLNSSLGPDRCVYKYSQSDLQCITEREGLLCGTCRNNSGVSVLLDKCVSCSDGYVGLIFLVVVLDVIVYLAITLIDRPIPHWIYPFIFYVQMAPFVSAFFPESFETVGVYMTFVKSALGFYFVYDFCLHSSLSPLVSYFLRYVPTLVAVVVFPSVWLVRKYLFKKKSLKHHGYWLIVVLLYPQLVHTSLTILNCPQLPDSNGSFVSRWFVDSSVQCFNGWHLALSLLAIALLVVSLLIIVTAIVLTCKKPDLFKKFIPPLIAAYNEDVQWWSGLELGRRLLVLILLTAFPKNTVYAIQALVVILSTYGYILPYKSMVANVFEVTLLLNLMTLMLLDATPLIRESLFTFGTGVSVSPISWLLFSFYYLPVILFVGLITTLALHQIVRFCIKRQKTRHSDADIDTDYVFVEKERASTTQSVHISELGTDEGEAVVMDFVTQYYNREE